MPSSHITYRLIQKVADLGTDYSVWLDSDDKYVITTLPRDGSFTLLEGTYPTIDSAVQYAASLVK